MPFFLPPLYYAVADFRFRRYADYCFLFAFAFRRHADSQPCR